MDDYYYKQFTKGDYDYTKLEKDDYNYDYSEITVSQLAIIRPSRPSVIRSLVSLAHIEN